MESGLKNLVGNCPKVLINPICPVGTIVVAERRMTSPTVDKPTIAATIFQDLGLFKFLIEVFIAQDYT
ncbi:MAG: hypothetical protein NT070_16300 [Cyanobacteria bacterium]|nr:hypothetical protein [Cyanobacteriota bacterium]